jgi:hypothetical protein
MRQMVLRLRWCATGAATAMVLLAAWATPALAQDDDEQDAPTPADLGTVIDNATTWVVGIIFGVATLFATVGAALYMMAGGDPAQLERGKTAMKSALVGYALALLAPVLLAIVEGILGV